MSHKIITIKADIHPDGDIYVYCEKKKEFRYVGLVVDNMKGFVIDDEGDIISVPMINPVYLKIKKLINK